MIQWYPGHMAKAKRILKEDLKLVDIVIEVADARVPLSSQNPDLRKLINEQTKVTVLNKKDLADAEYNKKWKKYFAEKKDGVKVLQSDWAVEKGQQRLRFVVQLCPQRVANANRQVVRQRSDPHRFN